MSEGQGGSLGARVRFHKVGHEFKHASGTVRVLNGISFDIAQGETLAIVGPSGSGKSTLLKMIIGSLAPSSGSVEVTVPQGGPLRRAIVFQSPTLLPWLSALENVRLPLELEGRLDGAADRARRVLERVGLARFADFKPDQLSGGMQSRVALARGLVTQPNLLLLDEPFSDLDEATSEDMMVDFAQLIEDAHVTAVIVTHSLKQAGFFADQAIVLGARAGGEIVARHRFSGQRPRRREYLATPEFSASIQLLRDSLRDAIHAPTT